MNIETGTLQQLANLEPGKVPLDLFNAMARLTVTPVVEIVPLRKRMRMGALGVLLCRRSENDPIWPGQYHIPGTIVGAQDNPGGYNDAFKRIFNGKLRDVETTEPVFAGSELIKAARGMEVALVHWVEVLTDPNEDMLFPVDELPSNMIEGHPGFIVTALASYTATKG